MGSIDIDKKIRNKETGDNFTSVIQPSGFTLYTVLHTILPYSPTLPSRLHTPGLWSFPEQAMTPLS